MGDYYEETGKGFIYRDTTPVFQDVWAVYYDKEKNDIYKKKIVAFEN